MTASRDDLPPDPPDDPDRAAILARRQRFVAVAMSGLATGLCAACPCLKMAVPDDEVEREYGPRTTPRPDEAAPATPPPETPPADGVNNDAPPTGQPPEPSPEPEPRPYVPREKAEPRPCLTIRRPQQ